MAQYDLNLRDYWRILRRRWQVAAAVTLLFGVMAYVLAEVQKPEPIYRASAVVKFERMTTLVGLLVESIAVSPGDNMATQAAVVRSFSVLERAAKDLRLLPAGLDSEAIKRNPRDIQLLSDLRAQVSATPEENTTLIEITVTSPEAVQAARIANAVAQAYREENLLTRNRQIREARRFIEQQLAEVGARLQQAEDGVRALKERRGFVSLAEETTATLTRLTALESEYEKVRQVQEETASQMQALQDPQVIAGLIPPRIFTDAGDPTIAKLNSSLLDLTVERENLLLSLTPEHPQIRDVNARIGNTRNTLARELTLKRQTLQGRAADVQRQIRRLRELQRSLPDVARQYAQLQRDTTIHENLLAQLRSKLQEVQIKEKEQVEEVSLVRPAIEPTRPTNPPQTLGKLIVGGLIGLLIGLVLALVLESLDTSIGTIQDVEGYLQLPVLGLIPNIDLSKDPDLAAPAGEAESALGRAHLFLISLLSPKSTIAEAYRSLRTNVDFLSLEKNLRTLSVTSASLMEGKTTTAINLALSIAQAGKRVLLVEADLRRPFIHHAFGISRDPGLAEVIAGIKDWRECTRTVTDLILGALGLERVMAVPNIDKLNILTSGTPPSNPAEFLNSQRMTELIAALRQEFDVVIFDSPPVLPVTDAAILASKTDAALLVYQVGRTSRTALKRAKVLLENVRGKVLGIVLTGLRAEVSPDYEELEYYRYAYGREPVRGSPAARPGSDRRSLLRRVAGLFKKGGSFSSRVLLVVLPSLPLAGGMAWSPGASPTGWVRDLPLRAENVRAAPAPLAGVEPLRSSPTQSAGGASAALHWSCLAQESTGRRGHPDPFPLQVVSRHEPASLVEYAGAPRQFSLEAFTMPAQISAGGGGAFGGTPAGRGSQPSPGPTVTRGPGWPTGQLPR